MRSVQISSSRDGISDNKDMKYMPNKRTTLRAYYQSVGSRFTDNRDRLPSPCLCVRACVCSRKRRAFALAVCGPVLGPRGSDAPPLRLGTLGNHIYSGECYVLLVTLYAGLGPHFDSVVDIRMSHILIRPAFPPGYTYKGTVL